MTVADRSEARRSGLPYRLLKPDNYDPISSYPLVLFLHGRGECGDDNERQLLHGVADIAAGAGRVGRPCFVVAPQCPEGVYWGARTLQHARDLIDEVGREFRTDANRVYVTGLSMGGFGTWAALAKWPELFAAAVPVCGGGDPATAPRFVRVPVWAFHGAEDDIVPVECSREMVAALTAAGGPARYTEYPAVGHDSWTPAYREPGLYEWLFGRERG